VFRGDNIAHRATYQPVAVGVDARHADEPALEGAFDEAALRGCPLLAVHAWHDSESLETLSYEHFAADWNVRDAAEKAL
jgi:hypothetical protein